MNQVRITTSAILIIMLAALPGCSKKDKAQQALQQQMSSATPAKAGKVPTSPNAVVTTPPQDLADTVALRDKALVHLKDNDFAAIYRMASDGFRKVGSEKQFVGLWQQQLQQTGPFKEAREVSQAIRKEDKALAYIFKVDYEKASKSLRLVFGRNKDGKMELIGINQREPK
jgi:hypothetical protein